LEALEDRTVPSTSANPATQFLLEAPPTAVAGQTTGLEIEALDASGHVARNYTGTVQITSTDAATKVGGAAVPTTFTFTQRDHGIHSFTLTPGTAGTETISTTDTTTSSLTGSTILQVNPAPVATHFQVVVPETTTAGSPTPVLVEAVDASGHVARNYTGTIQLTSTDPAATLNGAALPATFTFTAGDHGIHIFDIEFGTTGTQSVTATDTTTSSLTGTATTTVSAPTHHHHGGHGGDSGSTGHGNPDLLFQDFFRYF
jgi:hypothetical protein